MDLLFKSQAKQRDQARSFSEKPEKGSGLSSARSSVSRAASITSRQSYGLEPVGSQLSFDGLNFQGYDQSDYNLKIGDVIYFSRQVKISEQMNEVYMQTQGISSTRLDYEVLQEKPTTKSRYGLFRVETTFKYKNVVFTPEEQLKPEKVKRDLMVKKAVSEQVIGTPVHFGDIVMLRHMHSGGFLMLGDEPGNIPGSWEARIDLEGNERAWIRFLPMDTLRRIGDQVRYCDKAIVAMRAAHLDYYLCCVQRATKFKLLIPADKQWTITAYHQQQGWNINRYESNSTQKNLLCYGVPIMLRNKRTGCFLSVEYKSSLSDQEQIDSSHIILSGNEHDYNKYWIFENTYKILGGPICWDDPVFIRNATLSGYLTSNLQLSNVPEAEFNLKMANLSHLDHVEITSEFAIVYENLRIASNEVDPRRDILSKVVPIKGQKGVETTSNKEAQMQQEGKNEKLAIFEIQPLPDIYQEVTLKLSSLQPLFKNYAFFLQHFDASFEKTDNVRRELAVEEITKESNKVEKGLDLMAQLLAEAKDEIYVRRQKLLIGLNMHQLLVEIVQKIAAKMTEALEFAGTSAMQTRTEETTDPGVEVQSYANTTKTGWIKKIASTLIDKHEKTPKIISDCSKGVLQRIFKVLYLIVFDNEYACNAMQDMLQDLIELLPLHKQSGVDIPSLLQEVFRIIDPEIPNYELFFNNWVNRFEPIRDDNIESQTLHLKLLRLMLEVGRSARVKYQQYLIKLLLNIKDTRLQMIRIDIIDDRPCIQLQPGINLPAEDFLEHNVRLSPFVHYINGQKSCSNAIFFFDNLHDDVYWGYIHELLMLLEMLCRNKDNDAINFVKTQLNFTPQILLKLATSWDIHVSYRIAGQLLFQTTCVCMVPGRSSFVISRFRDMVFKMDEITDPDLQYKGVSNPENIENVEETNEILNWTLTFWLSNEDPFGDNIATTEQKIRYVQAVLINTCTLVDFRFASLLYMRIVLRTWIYIAAGFLTDRYNDNTHWCITFLREAQKEAESDPNLKWALDQLVGHTYFVILLSQRFFLQESIESLLWIFMQYKQQLDEMNLDQLKDNVEFTQEIQSAIKQALDREQKKSKVKILMRAIKSDILDQQAAMIKINQTPSTDRQITLREKQYTIVNDFPVPEDDAKDLPIITDILEKNILSDRFLAHYIFSSNQASKTEMVELAMIAFDFKRYMLKFLDRVNILENQELINFYDKMQELASTWRPIDTIDNFEIVKPTDFKKYEKMNAILKDLLDNLQLRGQDDIYQFSVKQNIIRHTGMQKQLMVIFSKYVHYSDHQMIWNDQVQGIKTFTYLITILYYFTLNNKFNQKACLKLMTTPNEFEPIIHRSPEFIRQASDFDHLSKEQSEMIISTIIQEFALKSGEKSVYLKNSMRYIILMMFDTQGKPKRQLQSITARVIIEKMRSRIDKYLTDAPSQFASLVRILAHSAISNPPVIQQCTKLLSVEKLKSLLDKSLHRYDVVLALLQCFVFVYIFNKDQKNVTTKDLISILEILKSYLEETKTKIPELCEIATQGLYEQVFPSDDPSLVDYMDSTYFDYNPDLEFWKLISQGDNWETQYGILNILQAVCRSADISEDRLLAKMEEIHGELNQFHEAIKNEAFGNEKLNFVTLEKCVQRSLHSVSVFIGVQTVKTPPAKDVILHTFGSGRDDKPKLARTTTGYARNLKFKNQNPSDLFTAIFSASAIDAQHQSSSSNKILQTDDQKLNDKFDMFITAFYDDFATPSFIDNIEETAVEIPIVCELMNAETSKIGLQKIVKKLQRITQSFRKHKELACLFHLLKAFMPQQDIGNHNKHHIFAKVYFKAGIISLAVNSLISMDHNIERLNAIILLNTIFDNPTPRLRLKFREWLSDTEMYYSFFLFIRSELINSKNRILMKYRTEKAKNSTRGNRELLNCFAAISMQTERLMFASEETKQILLNAIQFMQLCCDNCCLEFQNFMRTQAIKDDSRSVVNLVETMCSYMIDLYETYDYVLYSEELRHAVTNSIMTLIDLVTGPCIENQTFIGKSPQLLEYFDYLIQLFGKAIFDPDLDNFREENIKMYTQCILMLLTLTEGTPEKKVTSNLQTFLNFDALLEQTSIIYEKLIKGNERDIMLNRIGGKLSKGDYDIIATGVNILILILKIYPKKTISTEAYENYYKLNIGFVQIQKKDVLENHYFQVPSKCQMLTDDFKALVVQYAGSSHNQRLEDFIKQYKLAKYEMDHQKTIHNSQVLNSISKLWRVYGWISFLLIWAINAYMCFTDPSAGALTHEDTEDYQEYLPTLRALGFLQLVFAILSFAFYTYEYAPTIIYRNLAEDQDLAEYEITTYFRWHRNESIRLRKKHQKRMEKNNLYTQVWQVPQALKLYNLFCNRVALYNIVFITLSLLALMQYPFIFAILLLDVFKRSTDLQNIMLSITTNKSQLLATLGVTLIFIYIFGMWGFTFIPEFYVGDDGESIYDAEFLTFCDTLWNCFISTMYMGLRQGGGIGDALGFPPKSDDKYENRIAFDMFFFMIVSIIMLNIAFGIIIDTFGDLRNQRNEACAMRDNICFICDLERSKIELLGNGWSYHFMNEHSPFAYLAFIIYCSEKDIVECSGLEKYVKECLEKVDVSFFPTKDKVLKKMKKFKKDDIKKEEGSK